MLSVTALCITRARREWLPQAIAGFLAQDYEHKELLVLADHPGDVAGLIPDDPRIRVEACAAIFRPCRTIGAKRNLGCSLIETDLIATFDDDDEYASTTLSDQVRRIEETGKAVTGYHSAKMTDRTNWWKYCGAPQFAFGSSLTFRREWWIRHPYPEVQVGEDNAFGSCAWSNGQLDTCDAAGDLEPRRTDADHMIVNIHAGNTSKKIPHQNWRRL